MSTFKKSCLGTTLALFLCIAVCLGIQAQTTAQAPDSGQAAANLAPTHRAASAYDNGAGPAAAQSQSSAPSDPSYAPPAAPMEYSQNEPPPPPDQAGYDQGGYDQGNYNDYGDQSDVYAPEPPPPIPDYEQPYCPGDNYIWTPGYWYFSPAIGYYWVPGAWVLAPYIGALWTPGYWGFWGGRYLWYSGYWGPYIGFYGGINYGFGYFGIGYQGGYWNRGAFYYNRSVNRIGRGVRNVYMRNVRFNNRSRVSYNGGRGGLNVRPTQSQMTASRAQRYGALPAQRQLVQRAQRNRTQFANVNKGRPGQAAWAQPVNGGRRAPAARPTGLRPLRGGGPAQQQNRMMQQQNRTVQQQNRTVQQQNRMMQQQNRSLQQQNRTVQQQNRMMQQQNRTVQQQNRSVPQRQQVRPAPQRQQVRPAPQRQQSRPAPQQQGNPH